MDLAPMLLVIFERISRITSNTRFDHNGRIYFHKHLRKSFSECSIVVIFLALTAFLAKNQHQKRVIYDISKFAMFYYFVASKYKIARTQISCFSHSQLSLSNF